MKNKNFFYEIKYFSKQNLTKIGLVRSVKNYINTVISIKPD